MKIKVLLTYETIVGKIEGFELNSVLIETKDGKKYYSSWSFESLFCNEENKGFLYVGDLEFFYDLKYSYENEILEKHFVHLEDTEEFLKDTRIDIVEIFYYGCEIKGLKIEKIFIEDKDFKKVYSIKIKNSETTKRFALE